MKTKNNKAMINHFNRKNVSLFLLLCSMVITGAMAQSEALVVIDKDYAQKEKLQTKLPSNITIVYLDGSSNPWKMIRETLEKNRNLKSIHLFVESSYNTLMMGGIEYTDAAVDAEFELPMLEGLYLGSHYQLLLYTCNLSSNPEGLQLIKKIGDKAYFNMAAISKCTDIFNTPLEFDYSSLNQPVVAPILTNQN